MELIKYRFSKLIFIIVIKLQLLSLHIFYYLNRNEELFEIIHKNRIYLKTINKFLSEDHYSENDYGVQRRIYINLEKEIVKIPTYSDFLIFLINKLFKNNIPVKKNFPPNLEYAPDLIFIPSKVFNLLCLIEIDCSWTRIIVRTSSML